MARETLKSLKAQIAELEARNAALEARLSLARTTYHDQKARIAELEAQLNARGAAKVVPSPVVTTFTRSDGTLCERVRTGNRAIVREVHGTGMAGVEVAYQ